MSWGRSTTSSWYALLLIHILPCAGSGKYLLLICLLISALYVVCLFISYCMLTHLSFLLHFFRSSPGDDLVDWNSGVSIRPYVHKNFFHLIWCVGRPRPHMRTSVTSTRSKVKVTELPKLRKVHFSRSISSAGFGVELKTDGQWS